MKLTQDRDGKDVTVEETWVAVKEGGGWKIAFLLDKDKPDESLLKRLAQRTDDQVAKLRKINSATERVTREVKDGKYDSREEAQRALEANIVIELFSPGEPMKEGKEKEDEPPADVAGSPGNSFAFKRH